MIITCRKTRTLEEKEDVLAIRRAVFIGEQNVPEDIEYDDLDKVDAGGVLHFICHVDGKAVGAGRLRVLNDSLKVERVAVLKEFRGWGLGKLIVDTILDECAKYPGKPIGGHAQLIAREFYEKLGFRAVGEVFEEAGIPHIKMVYGPSGQ